MSGALLSLFLPSLFQHSAAESQHNYLYAFLLLAAAVASFLIALVAWRRRQIGPSALSLVL
ncbi:MAG: hypothetical protein ABFR50_09360, partial [Candidatus Fermentibacteria bacterium]